jgi:hypothetical protein
MGKQEADSLQKIGIYWLKKNGFLQGWKSGGVQWTNGWSDKKSSIGIEISTGNFPDEKTEDGYIRFQYTQTDLNGDKKDFDYKTSLTTTPCNFGGVRYWFICPLSVNGRYCGRRVGVLYKAGDYFGCRHCYNLTYSSRLKSGIFKTTSNISIPEIEALEKELKTKFYKGKMTKRYKRYLIKKERLLRNLAIINLGLGK